MGLDVSKATEGSTYQLASQELKQNCSMCFTFYYYLYSINNSTINVNLVYNKVTHNEMTIAKGQEKGWHRSQVEITDIYVTYKVRCE